MGPRENGKLETPYEYFLNEIRKEDIHFKVAKPLIVIAFIINILWIIIVNYNLIFKFPNRKWELILFSIMFLIGHSIMIVLMKYPEIGYEAYRKNRYAAIVNGIGRGKIYILMLMLLALVLSIILGISSIFEKELVVVLVTINLILFNIIVLYVVAIYNSILTLAKIYSERKKRTNNKQPI